jgi:DNA-binding transcriptional ArsR family regulator
VPRGLQLFNSHGSALLELGRDPDIRLRDLAARIGLTERAAQALVRDLVEAGHVTKIREGRRNRYTVIQPLAIEPGIAPLAGGAATSRRAIVLACSDFRFQRALRDLMIERALLDRAETFLWPGGSAALGGPEGPAILRAMLSAVGPETPPRVVLVAHQGCHARGAHVGSRTDAFETARAVLRRRRKGVDRAKAAFGFEPELWFLTERGAQRLRARGSVVGQREVQRSTLT